MNVQCKNKKCNKINNELVQVVIVLGPLNMDYYFPTLLPSPAPCKISKNALVHSGF